MPKLLPPDHSALVTTSSPDYFQSGSTPARLNWVWIVAGIAVAALIFIMGAKSQMRTTKPALVGPFAGGASTPAAAPLVIHVAGEVMKPGVYEFPFEARVQDAIRKAGGPKKGADLNSINMAAFLEDGQKIEVRAKTIIAANNLPPTAAPAPASEAESTPVAIPEYSSIAPREEIFAPIPELAPRESKPKKRDSPKRERAKKAAAKPKVLPEVPRQSTPQGGESQNADPKYFEKNPLNLNTATQEQLELLPGVGPAMAQKILAARKAAGSFKSVEELDEIRGIGEKKMEALRPLVTVG